MTFKVFSRTCNKTANHVAKGNETKKFSPE